MLFFLVTSSIRTFIDSNFGQPIRDYFRDVSIIVKIVIVILFVLLLLYLFPYKPKKSRK
ncbi:hypothetical protein ERICI_03218 [Paenibacillus larvae subsp. larvae]|nr:hypothetical protein ERICI_03218 [Paenibacillus larvae subsp. larvae]ETK26341.1 hypothetical protein ERIC1_2c05390 [Paenibacillus larvae subsp. larvae DSM 25719]